MQKRWRGSAQQHDGRLGHLRIFKRRDGVRHAGAGCHRGHAGNAGQPCGGIGGKDGCCLAARIGDADAARLGSRKNRRNVPAAEREEHPHAFGLKRSGNRIAAMRGRLDIRLHRISPSLSAR